MSAQSSSTQHFASLYITVPILGLLMFTVPWEPDRRVEPAAKRMEQLRHPGGSFLVDTCVALGWGGLFPWQQNELKMLTEDFGKSLEAVRQVLQEVVVEEPVEKRVLVMTPRDAINLLLQTGGDMNTRLAKGMTPLGHVIQLADLEGLKTVLEKGADPNLADADGDVPLKILCSMCETKAEERNYNKCLLKFSGIAHLCIDQREAATAARSRDVKLLEVVKTLVLKGARADSVIPKERVMLEGSNEQPRDISVLEYAQRNCPDFIVNAINGTR